MADITVDIAIIGTGTAGMSAYRAAREYTDRIALLEAGPYGTTCARVGCMPSKLLIAPAEARHRAESFEAFGLQGAKPEVEGAAVMQRVRSERDRFVGFVQEAVADFDPAHKIQGHARFTSDTTLELDDGRSIETRASVIATGSRPHIPEMLRAAGSRLLTNDNLFELDTLPGSVAVFGAGVIGLELGQALHRLGVRMRLFGRGGSVGPLQDPAIRSYAEACFAAEYALHSNATVQTIEETPAGVRVCFDDGTGHAREETFDYLLCATGRRPNLDALGLDRTTLVRDERGVPRYCPQTMQCGGAPVFIAGDANGTAPVLHEAADEGRLAGENAGRYPHVYRRERRVPLAIVFSDPQIAIVGPSYASLQTEYKELTVGTADFEDQGRARSFLINRGRMHLYGNRATGQFLGAEMIVPAAEHMAHLLALALHQRMQVEALLQMPFYHPVLEEGLRSGLRHLLSEMGRATRPPLRCIDCGPGG